MSSGDWIVERRSIVAVEKKRNVVLKRDCRPLCSSCDNVEPVDDLLGKEKDLSERERERDVVWCC